VIFPSTLGRRARLILSTICLSLAAVAGSAGTAQALPGQEAGIQAHLMWAQYDSAAEVDSQLDRAKEAGAQILRVDVGWASIEDAGKGQYNQWYLRRLDAVVDKAQARGIKLLLTFWETPCWASSAPDSAKQNCSGRWWDREVQRYAPTNPRDYADALAYVANRYKGRVAGWEIWNEPNHPVYFKSGDPVRDYAALVKAGYPAAKAADPSAVILAGSLADADFAFTEKLLDQGIAGNFDAYSVHPYSGDRSPLDAGDDRWIQNSYLRGVPAVRETLLRRGQDVPLWLTEFGWSTCTVRDRQSYANCVDPEVQARHLTEAFTQMRSWPYVKAAFWFNLKDTSDDTGDRVENYGLLHTDGQPKPAFQAFAAAARDIGGPGAPATDQTPAGTTGTGTSGPASTDTGIATEAGDRVTLKAKRSRKRVKVLGSAPRGEVVTIRVYRYIKSKRRFSTRRSYAAKVAVNRRGRYSRNLGMSSLRKGRWRITARLHGTSGPRLARADIGSTRTAR
jgi:hypothetical protein